MADVMVLFGSGGHSSEMLMLIQNAKLANKIDNEVNKVIVIVSEDDRLIGEKINQEFSGKKNKLQIVTLTRGRKIGQSYLTAVWTFIVSLLQSMRIVLNNKPKLCLTNGPAIGVAVALAIRCLQIVPFVSSSFRCDIIYVESFCRTKTLSLSGKLIYHLRLANEFYVQWPELHSQYPRVKFKGLLV